MPDFSRRSFLNASAGMVTATALAAAAKLSEAAAAEPLNIGIIGPGDSFGPFRPVNSGLYVSGAGGIVNLGVFAIES